MKIVRKVQRPGTGLIAGALAMAITAAACSSSTQAKGSSPTTQATQGTASPTSALATLTAAAKQDGSVTWYTSLSDTTANQVQSAFEKQYGVSVKTVRLTSAELATRFSAEAKTGSPGADVLTVTFGQTEASTLLNNGFVTPLQNDNIPDYASFPQQFQRNSYGTAIVSIIVQNLAFNTNQVSKGAVPTSWADILKPQWKGKILYSDPKISPTVMALWAIILDKEGKNFLTQFAAQKPKINESGGSSMIQLLAAGEADLAFPEFGNFVAPAAQNGAPVASTVPGYTTGAEQALFVAAKAQHPNAARLFADFLLSQSGTALMATGPGTATPYGTGLPSNYVSPPDVSPATQAEILQLLGLQS